MTAYRFLVAAIVSAFLGATTTVDAGTWGEISVVAPNNDDHIGPNNPNVASFANLTASVNDDQLVVSLPTGGTTEWEYRLISPFAPSGIPAFRVELGFGLGDNFISATTVFPELDFDYPLPSDPGATVGTYAQVEHFPQLINFSDGDYGDIRLSVDVPDLPEFVKDFYTGEELADLPEGAVPFTLRRQEGNISPVPEPSTMPLIVVIGCLAFVGCRWRNRGERSRPGE